MKNDRRRRDNTEIAPFLRRAPSSLMGLSHFVGALAWRHMTHRKATPMATRGGILPCLQMINIEDCVL